METPVAEVPTNHTGHDGLHFAQVQRWNSSRTSGNIALWTPSFANRLLNVSLVLNFNFICFDEHRRVTTPLVLKKKRFSISEKSFIFDLKFLIKVIFD